MYVNSWTCLSRAVAYFLTPPWLFYFDTVKRGISKTSGILLVWRRVTYEYFQLLRSEDVCIHAHGQVHDDDDDGVLGIYMLAVAGARWMPEERSAGVHIRRARANRPAAVVGVDTANGGADGGHARRHKSTQGGHIAGML